MDKTLPTHAMAVDRIILEGGSDRVEIITDPKKSSVKVTPVATPGFLVFLVEVTARTPEHPEAPVIRIMER